MRARVLLALLLVPAIAAAQRGRGGVRISPRDTAGMGGGMSGFGTRSPAPQFPSGGDLEKRSPVHVLLDKRKKLALTDSQVTQLQALDAQDAPLRQRADSLRKANRAPAGDYATLTDDERQRLIAFRIALADFMAAVSEREHAAADQALALLTDEQRPKAAELLEQQREAMRRAQQRGPGAMDGSQDPGRGGRRP